MLTIHKKCLDKNAIEYLEIVKSCLENDIKSTISGAKKSYTPNQLINIHENLFNRIRFNFELYCKNSIKIENAIIDFENKKINKCILEMFDIDLKTCGDCHFNKICKWIERK